MLLSFAVVGTCIHKPTAATIERFRSVYTQYFHAYINFYLMTLVLTKQWQMKWNVFVDFLCFLLIFHSFSCRLSTVTIHTQKSEEIFKFLSFHRSNGCVLLFLFWRMKMVFQPKRNYFAWSILSARSRFIYIWKLIPVIKRCRSLHLRLDKLRPLKSPHFQQNQATHYIGIVQTSLSLYRYFVFVCIAAKSVDFEGYFLCACESSRLIRWQCKND